MVSHQLTAALGCLTHTLDGSELSRGKDIGSIEPHSSSSDSSFTKATRSPSQSARPSVSDQLTSAVAGSYPVT